MPILWEIMIFSFAIIYLAVIIFIISLVIKNVMGVLNNKVRYAPLPPPQYYLEMQSPKSDHKN